MHAGRLSLAFKLSCPWNRTRLPGNVTNEVAGVHGRFVVAGQEKPSKEADPYFNGPGDAVVYTKLA